MHPKRRLWSDLRRDWQLYLFLLIPVVYIIIFAYVPMGGLQIAFKDFAARKGIFGSPWVGLKHFKKFFSSVYFGRTVGNTLALSAYSLACGWPLPIIVALMLNCYRSQKFKSITQTIMTLPHFISVVVLVGMMFQMFSARNGIYGAVIFRLTGTRPPDPFATPSNFRHFYLWSGVWQDFGWGSIIYLAALAGVDPSLHEAATVDGASRFKRVLHVDLPTILPTIVIMLILRFGNIMSIGFEKVFLLQNDLNLSYSEVISTYVYKVGLSGGGKTDFSYATAIGFFNSVVNLVLIVVVNFIAGKVGDTSLW